MTLILLVTFFAVSAQEKNAVVNQFKAESLPKCINYSYDEQVFFGAIFHVDSTVVQYDDTTYTEYEDVYERNNYEPDVSTLLERKFVKQHLLPNAEFIYDISDNGKDTLYAMSIEEYLDSDFFPLCRIIMNRKYVGVVYERIYSHGSIPSSEKYLCTVSNSGKFISRILIASFVYSGTGTSISGERFPWFPEESGCINKDMTITFTSWKQEQKRYKIQRDGKIVELKE